MRYSQYDFTICIVCFKKATEIKVLYRREINKYTTNGQNYHLDSAQLFDFHMNTTALITTPHIPLGVIKQTLDI